MIKTTRNSEFSQFRLFARIGWVPPFKTEKLLRVMRRTGKNRLETYSTIFLDRTGIEYARIEWVPPLRGAQPRISGSCFFAMIDWIPSEGGTHSE